MKNQIKPTKNEQLKKDQEELMKEMVSYGKLKDFDFINMTPASMMGLMKSTIDNNEIFYEALENAPIEKGKSILNLK